MFGQGSQWGKISLWDAAADGNLELCKTRMKSATTHVNGKDAQGKTALHEAARWGHVHVVEYLVSQGADIHATTVEGSTPLHLAARFGQDNVVEWLVGHGADINCQDVYKDTPLIAASGAGKVSTCGLLLSLGADKSIKNEQGRDALGTAKDTDTTAVLTDDKYDSPTRY